MLEKILFPWLGSRPVSAITPTELFSTLRRVEARGAIETAKRVKQVAERSGALLQRQFSTEAHFPVPRDCLRRLRCRGRADPT